MYSKPEIGSHPSSVSSLKLAVCPICLALIVYPYIVYMVVCIYSMYMQPHLIVLHGDDLNGGLGSLELLQSHGQLLLTLLDTPTQLVSLVSGLTGREGGRERGREGEGGGGVQRGRKARNEKGRWR